MTAVLDPVVRETDTPDRGPRRSWGSWLVVVLVLVAEAAVLADVRVPVLRFVLGAFVLVVVPAWVLARRVSWRTSTPAGTCYALGLTLLGVLLTALALNTFLPLVGVDRPLAPLPLVAASTVMDLSLLAWRRQVPLVPEIGAVADWRLDLGTALGALAVLVAVVGAVRLNNDAGPQLAVTGLALAVACFGVLMGRRHGTAGRDAVATYLASLAVLLAVSLRGWYVTGHDVQREYYAALLTHQAQHWRMEAFPDPYNACLSISMLPSVVATITGLDLVWVFKLVVPVVVALMPVVVGLLGRRLVGRRLAVMGVVYLVAFPTFSDLPFMGRQGIAFVFLSLLLLTATETTWSTVRHRAVVLLAGIGVVLAHYGTTYLLLIALVAGTVGTLLHAGTTRLRARRSPLKLPPRRRALLAPGVVVGLLAATWLWTGPATHSSGHVVTTAEQSLSRIVGGGSSGPGSSDLSYALLHGSEPSPQQRLDAYAHQAEREGATDRARGGLVPLRSADQADPRLVPTPASPTTSAGGALERIGIGPATLNAGLRSGAAMLIQVLLLVGVLGVLFVRRWGSRFSRELRWAGFGILTALAVTVLVPGLSAEYGVLRAFEQALVLLAPVVAVGAMVLLWPLRRLAYAGAATLTLVIALSLTGVVPAVLGGYQPQLSVANAGTYHDLYYTTPQEIAAADWLRVTTDGATGSGDGTRTVVSDRFTSNRLRTYLGPRVAQSQDFFPSLLPAGAFVVAGPQTVRGHTATVSYTGDLLTYRYPVDVLTHRLDLVYSNGSTEVFR